MDRESFCASGHGRATRNSPLGHRLGIAALEDDGTTEVILRLVRPPAALTSHWVLQEVQMPTRLPLYSEL
ncbi:hypothetical protein TNCV_4748301 [Trichonephila clavipes]|nr:hypothetical protein TNCV_4748301 [Trichonephila clavipes]